jgi:hypothetical protein
MLKHQDSTPQEASGPEWERKFVEWVRDREKRFGFGGSVRYVLLGLGILLSVLWLLIHYLQ